MSILPHWTILGNANAQSEAITLVQESRHHTMIFSGSLGVGKSSFAQTLACYCLGGAELQNGRLLIMPDHRVSRQIDNGSHPDFLCITAEKYAKKSQQIPAEALRDIHAFSQRQGDSVRRVIIIDSIDDCHHVLAQGLLKLLEEPPEKVLFILINHSEGRLLDTIRSRAQLIRFHPLNPTEMREGAETWNLGEAPADIDCLLALADGVPSRLIALATADLEGLMEKLHAHLAEPQDNSAQMRAIVEYICHKKHDHLAAWRALSAWITRAVLREKISGQRRHDFAFAEGILRMFRDIPRTETMLNTLQSTQELMGKINLPPAYLDAEQVVHHALNSWHQLLHSRQEQIHVR